MNIAIVGPGRIGSTFAFYLSRGGHQVTLIARGKRLEELQRDQAIVAVNGDRAPVQVATALDPTAPYDLVLVTVLSNQVDALLPALKASAAKTILFMFNTFDAPDRLRDAVGTERFASGFPAMAAFFVDGKLKSNVTGPGMVTTLSSQAWAEILKKSGLPTEFEPDMTSFLRSHAAFVAPLMAAAMMTWKRSSNLTWSEASKLTGALIEALGLVRSLGQVLKPGFVAWLARMPTVALTLLIYLFTRTATNKAMGEFGPNETRALIDSMAAAAPGKTPRLLSIRP
jgi:2-dehydropantoate 2-reductase